MVEDSRQSDSNTVSAPGVLKLDAVTPTERQTEKKVKYNFFLLRKKSALTLAFIIILLVGSWFFMSSNDNSLTSSILAGASITNTLSDSDGPVLAEVNGKPIYQYKFDQEIKLYLFLENIPETGSNISRAVLLQEAIDKMLLLQKADEAGYVVENHYPEDIEKEVFKKNPSSGEINLAPFKNELAKRGIDYNSFIVYMAESIAIEKFVNDKVFNQLVISDGDVENYYAAHPGEFFMPEQVRVSHILVKNSELARQIIQELDEGKDFATLAKEHSIDSSAAKGGDLGYLQKGKTVPEFEEAAFSLTPIGDYTKNPVKTKFGYHIILLVGKNKARPLSFDEVKDNLKQQLIYSKRAEWLDQYVTNLKRNAEITIR